jgi:hypothetical protein
MEMKKVRDMLRVVIRNGSFVPVPPRKITKAQHIEVEEKLAILRMLNDHNKIPTIGVRFSAGIFYIELKEEIDVTKREVRKGTPS